MPKIRRATLYENVENQNALDDPIKMTGQFYNMTIYRKDSVFLRNFYF